LAASRGNARVSILGDATGLKRATKEGENALGHLAKEGTSHFAKLAKAATAAGAAYVGISEIKGAVTTTEELTGATLKLHRALGLSIEESSRWAAVARARGIDNKQLQQSFGTLSKNVEAARQGYTSSARKARSSASRRGTRSSARR
jgi:hypothetical protein